MDGQARTCSDDSAMSGTSKLIASGRGVDMRTTMKESRLEMPSEVPMKKREAKLSTGVTVILPKRMGDR